MTAIAERWENRTPDFDKSVMQTMAEPRCYQRRVVCKAVDALLAPMPDNQLCRSILINSATGSGKSFMGLMTAKMIRDLHDSGIGIGWSAMRQNLLEQVHGANSELGVRLDGLTTISMFDKNPPTHDKDGRKIDLLIVDEAQHDSAASMMHLHNVIQPRRVLGLSATPYRTDRVKLCFEKVIKDAGIKQLMELGYLSSYVKFVIPDWKPETVVKFYLSDPERWGKSAMYWRTTEEAFECYRGLRRAGTKVSLVTGGLSYGSDGEIIHRDRALDGIESGEYDVLVNLFVLTEGWDCPSLKTAWVRDSSKGCTIQMAGRAFRKFHDIPLKQIVQSGNTKFPIERLASPKMIHQWMDESWRSLTASRKADIVATNATMMIGKLETKMPDFIKAKKGGGSKKFQNVGDVFLEH